MNHVGTKTELFVEDVGQRRIVVLPSRHRGHDERSLTERSDHRCELDDLGPRSERHEDPHRSNSSSKCRIIRTPASNLNRSERMGSPITPRMYSPTRSAPAAWESGSPPEN